MTEILCDPGIIVHDVIDISYDVFFVSVYQMVWRVGWVSGFYCHREVHIV